MALAACCSLLLLAWHTSAQTTVSVNQIKALLQTWNSAHNDRDLTHLENLYMPTVILHGKQLSKASCIKTKSTLFATYTNFTQEIDFRNVVLTAYSSGSIKCEFTTEVRFNANVRKYASYLLLAKTPQGYLIAGESDAATDRQIGYKLNLGDQLAIINTDPVSELHPVPVSTDKILKSRIVLPVTGGLLLLIMVWIVRKRTSTEKATPPFSDSPWKADRFSSLHSPLVNTGGNTTPNDFTINKEKGDAFERYIVKKFDTTYFRLIDWRSDKSEGDIYPESNLYPDLRYCFNQTKFFEVECKFRKELYKNSFSINHDQLNRYRRYQYENHIDIYLALGLGGEPDNPEQLFLIPLDQLKSVNYYDLKRYRKNTKHNFFMNRNSLELS